MIQLIIRLYQAALQLLNFLLQHLLRLQQQTPSFFIRSFSLLGQLNIIDNALQRHPAGLELLDQLNPFQIGCIIHADSIAFARYRRQYANTLIITQGVNGNIHFFCDFTNAHAGFFSG